MIEEKDIYNCIVENKAPYIRVYDMNKNLLHIYDEDTDPASTVMHLKTILPMFKSYGKVIVNSANEMQKKNAWTRSYYMTVLLDKGTATQVQGPQLTPWNMPPGYVHQDLMMAKLAAIEQANKHAMEMFRLELKMKESSNQDPMKQVEKIMPWAMYAMGKSTDEIVKVSTAMRIGNANLSGTMPSLPTNSLTFKDIEAKPTDEKAKQFQSLADSISSKVSIEEMIMLYSEIDKDPSLVQTALQALPLLKK